jgi:hypothetical protein
MMNPLLLIAALIDAVIALLHVYVIVKGPVAYRQFGAGETIVAMAERGSWFPALLTSGITVVFLIFGAYYLAAGGWIPAPPQLLLGMGAIALIYLLRGVAIVPVALSGRKVTAFELHSSVISLVAGLVHAAAALLYFKHACTSAMDVGAIGSSFCPYIASATQHFIAP